MQKSSLDLVAAMLGGACEPCLRARIAENRADIRPIDTGEYLWEGIQVQAYHFFDKYGSLEAFWVDDTTGSLEFCRPDFGLDQRWSVDRARWEATLADRVRFGAKRTSAPDFVDAALHLLSLRGTLVDETTLELARHAPGQHYPRMWRGRYSALRFMFEYSSPFDPEFRYGATFVQSLVAAASLFEELGTVFRYIEPDKRNASTFGFKFRELLILAATELEANWRGILDANAYSSDSDSRYTTNDYVKLCQPLQLDAWSVKLSRYPSTDPRSPFARWSAEQPTASLKWYEAYNSVKHNREANLDAATLENVVDAMAALHITLAAQWGPEIFLPEHDAARSPFRIETAPYWSPGEISIPALEVRDEDEDEEKEPQPPIWVAVPYFERTDSKQHRTC